MKNTEELNPMSKGMDALPAEEFLRLMHAEDREAFDAVGRALPAIAKLVEASVETVRAGGKVVYAGAGTSGRIAAMDAAEVKPTFNSDSFAATVAGGPGAITGSVEGAEDDTAQAEEFAAGLGDKDLAVGIAASGRTPFVVAFLKKAKERGLSTWLVSSNPAEYPFVDGVVALLTGPEVVAGSTRLKAATAQKLCLNMVSTATMAKLGKVYDGYMVDVVPANRKLVERANRIVSKIAGCDIETAGRYLALAGMRPKTAIVMLKKNVPKEEAERLLSANRDSLRGLLDY
jgi:N-acetylmuramic acid 6-phosphate etherase